MYGVVSLFVKMAAAAALVCLFVMLFVVIDCSLLSLRLACVWPIRSVPHGTADNDGHGDDATRLRVFGGVCGAALADVRLGARSMCVRVWILPRGWRVFACWMGCPEPRVGCVRVRGVRVVAGRVRAGGWVGG
jgi:hypothetical protein